MQGGGGHISWASWSTIASLTVVVEHYTRALGPENLDRTPTHATWRFPTDRPTRTLSVELPTANAPWKHECGTPAGAGTVITITDFPR